MLKRSLIAAALFLAASAAASAQGVRIGDNMPVLSSLTNPGVVSTVQPATIAICVFPANAVPCTNKATTYTSVTLGTPCSTSTQIVLAGTSSCVATTDPRGNWGAWVANGNYDYTITVTTGQSFGPFTVTAGIPTSSAVTVTSVSSVCTPAASTGFLRLCTSDQINWRNAANNADITLNKSGALSGNYPADTIQTGGGFGATYFSAFSNNTAAGGLLRLQTTDTINWRNNANNADVSLSKDTVDRLLWPNGLAAGFFQPFGAAVASSGVFRLNTGDTIAWRNNANSGDVALSKTAADELQYAGAGVRAGSTLFASLGTPASGVIIYCSDCTIANPCAGAGTGALAKRLNGVWVCN